VIWEHGSSPSKFDFSKGQRFGYKNWAFVTLFGSFLPTQPYGYKVVRVNVETGESVDFLANPSTGTKNNWCCTPSGLSF
jgi:glucose/arabinose dehydrogenase